MHSSLGKDFILQHFELQQEANSICFSYSISNQLPFSVFFFLLPNFLPRTFSIILDRSGMKKCASFSFKRKHFQLFTIEYDANCVLAIYGFYYVNVPNFLFIIHLLYSIPVC
jgi:hypothetical protein